MLNDLLGFWDLLYNMPFPVKLAWYSTSFTPEMHISPGALSWVQVEYYKKNGNNAVKALFCNDHKCSLEHADKSFTGVLIFFLEHQM